MEVEVTPKNFGRIAAQDGQTGDDAAHSPGREGNDLRGVQGPRGRIVSGTVRRSIARM